ncbi:MAG: hypothetical protein A2X56_09365 [Nitrospirae bacterium GWC2_57_13]|nr:MAG: hypothetical protein A2X56_09365 [Nitrospirae bacterium GWC2_57_13]OGW44090.1 MAG: hypothetical protein A2X57_04135 [Nitrospirae bacterium GWD2_57_8]
MSTESRQGKGVYCPFCSSPLARPRPIQAGVGATVDGGACSCGARYLTDPTGKNVGELMLQALTMMGEALSRGPFDLAQGVDYDEVILSYDWRMHRSLGEPEGYMDGHGRLYMFRERKNTP